MFFCPEGLLATDELSYAQEIQKDVAEDKVYLLENIRQKVTIPSEKTILDALFCEDGPQAIMLFQKQLREYPDPALDNLSTSRIAAYNLALHRTSPLQKTSITQPSPKSQPIAVKADTTEQSSKPRLHASQHPTQPQPSVAVEDSTKHSAKHHSNTPRLSLLKKDTTKQSSNPKSSAPVPSSETSKESRVPAGPETSTVQFGSFENRQNAETLAKEISQNASVEIVKKGDLYKVQLKTHYASKEEAANAAKKLPVKAIVVPSK